MGPWENFLNGAYQTTMAMFNQTDTYNVGYYTQFGIMEDSIFLALLPHRSPTRRPRMERTGRRRRCEDEEACGPLGERVGFRVGRE